MTTANTNAPATARLPIPTVAYLLLVAALLIFGLYALLISGPALRAAALDQIEQAIAEEDRAFCEMFGARSGDAFVACSKALATVRHKQAIRDDAAAQGML
jgi:hypothetical protein